MARFTTVILVLRVSGEATLQVFLNVNPRGRAPFGQHQESWHLGRSNFLRLHRVIVSHSQVAILGPDHKRSAASGDENECKSCLILGIVSYMHIAVTLHGIFCRVLKQVPNKNRHDHHINCSVHKKLSLVKRIYTYFLLWMNYCIIRYVT